MATPAHAGGKTTKKRPYRGFCRYLITMGKWQGLTASKFSTVTAFAVFPSLPLSDEFITTGNSIYPMSLYHSGTHRWVSFITHIPTNIIFIHTKYICMYVGMYEIVCNISAGTVDLHFWKWKIILHTLWVHIPCVHICRDSCVYVNICICMISVCACEYIYKCLYTLYTLNRSDVVCRFVYNI